MSMYPTIPAELVSGAVQVAIWFVTLLGTLLSLKMAGRG